MRARVRLYVAGDSANSVAALANLRAFLADHPRHRVELEVIDVLRDAEHAFRAGVLVTPTLVRVAPLPECRVVGSLRDRAALAVALAFEGAT
jgi:circadian clock protein KaiB